MLVNKAFKVRLYPSREQREMLDNTFGCCRFLYNKELEEHERVYDALKDDKEALHSYKYKTEKEYKGEYPFLKVPDAKALQCMTSNLFAAYKNFFEGRARTVMHGSPQSGSLLESNVERTAVLGENHLVPSGAEIRGLDLDEPRSGLETLDPESPVSPFHLELTLHSC